MLRWITRLILLLVVAIFAPGETSARTETRVWPPEVQSEKLASGVFGPEASILRQAAAMQAAKLQQESSGQGYDFASGCVLAAESAGLDWVTATAKGSRPHPSKYMSVTERQAHAALFDGGASRFMTKANFEKYGIGQRDGTAFVMTRAQADQLLTKVGGNAAAMEDALGLPRGFLQGNQLIRVDIPNPGKAGLRIPSGNEAGANPLWQAGGRLPDGQIEGVIDVRRLGPGSFETNPLKF